MPAFDVNSVPNFDAQIAHVGWGAFLTLAVTLWLPIGAAALIVLGVSFAKEAFEALGIAPWEPKQPWSSSLVDFGFFSVGIAAAIILHLI